MLTGILATMARVAFCVAFQMMQTGYSYLALFAVLIGICSGILGVAALLAWGHDGFFSNRGILA
ncbi:MAG: hypothetical protein ABIP64_15515 [Burkholderiales bacterium]